MKLNKKIAVLFFYFALSILISGYLYLNPELVFNPYNHPRISMNSKWFNYSLIIEVVGLFLLLGWFAYKGDKKEDK